MASTRLYKVYSGATGTNAQKKWTVSVWVKKQKTGSPQTIAGGYRSSNNSYCDLLKFNANGNLKFFSNSDAGNADTFFQTNARYNDVNGWMHIVQNVDTTQSTQSERFKMWVNGEQITSWSSATYPVQNDSLYWGMNTDVEHQIGAINSGEYWDGLMSHFYFIQNETHAPTVFGETDATTGEWKIKTNVTGVNYTGRSFYIFKDDNSYTDQSGNNNTWTLSGTLTKTEDNPSNVFATMNPLDKNTNVVLENGNTTSYSSAGNTWVAANRATLGIAKDKFYWEMKITGSGTANGLFFGVCADTVALITSQGIQDNATERAKGILLFCDNGQSQLDTNSRVNMTSAPAFNDVLGCAVDRDNNTVKFYKNGSEVGSIDISSSPLATCSHIMPFMINYHTNTKFNFNFGNGYFGTTAVSSAGTNASGIGIFEYDVPTGFTALSTKGLNL